MRLVMEHAYRRQYRHERDGPVHLYGILVGVRQILMRAPSRLSSPSLFGTHTCAEHSEQRDLLVLHQPMTTS